MSDRSGSFSSPIARPSSVRVRFAAFLLLVVGLSQMAADLLEQPLLKGVAAATMLAPAPKVFSSVRGYETFSTTFVLEGESAAGTTTSATITPELYTHVRGPYQRRNIYGAALSYGPVLPAELMAPVMRYALCDDAPLVWELGLLPEDLARNVRVRFIPRSGIDMKALGLPGVIAAPCGEASP